MDVIAIWYGEADAPQIPDVPPAPTVDSNCGYISVDTVRQPVDVLLVLDNSLSMNWSITEDCYCKSGAGTGATVCTDTTNCSVRWDAVKSAMDTTLSTSQYVNWGLKFLNPSSGSTCTVTKTIEVPVAADSASKIQTQIGAVTLSLGTPTAAALTAATDYLKTLSDPNEKVILLATDGEPNCGGNPASVNTDDVTGASNAAAAANTAGFPVYVIGIGPSLSNLTQLASNGGTKDYYPVTSPDQLASALSSIGKTIGSCKFTANQEPPDSGNIGVYVNKNIVNKDDNNGWKFGASTQEIVLTGSYCDQMTSGNDATVQILFGCPGAPGFPPFVP